ncbi:MAG TPA: hypothetical protein PK092_07415 [Chitinophagaceae bacterium]|nr:hypothetical protein [Chitinophagaceae bacterium]
MRKLLMILMAFSLLTACKDKKEADAKKTETKSADDYRSGDNKTGDDNKGNDDKEKSGVSEDNNKTDNTNNFSGSGWPQSEKDSFISSCVREAMKGGRSREVASSYCQCMMEKMEAEYPDINKAAKLTNDEIEKVMMKYRDGCLSQ